MGFISSAVVCIFGLNSGSAMYVSQVKQEFDHQQDGPNSTAPVVSGLDETSAVRSQLFSAQWSIG